MNKIKWLYPERELQFLISENLDPIKAINEVFEHGQFINGKEVSKLENEIDMSGYFKYYNCIGISNGTDAITCGLLSLGITQGDYVVTTPYTFISTIESIVRVGAIPILVDIDPDTYLINTDKLKTVIASENIKAIVPVSIFGHEIDYKKYPSNIPIIEDAAQSFWKNDSARAELKTVSFHPTKNLGAAGDAGAIFVRKDLTGLYEKIKLMRNHGMEKDPSRKYHYNCIGGNWRLDSIQAAVLSCKLPFHSILNHRRKLIAYQYSKTCEMLNIKNNYRLSDNQHQFVIEFKDSATLLNFISHFNNSGITTCRFYPIPLHIQESYKLGKRGDYPVCESVCSKVVAIPISPFLRQDEVDYICSKIEKFFS